MNKDKININFTFCVYLYKNTLFSSIVSYQNSNILDCLQIICSILTNYLKLKMEESKQIYIVLRLNNRKISKFFVGPEGLEPPTDGL